LPLLKFQPSYIETVQGSNLNRRYTSGLEHDMQVTVPYITLYYSCGKPPTSTCFGHSCGHSQGGAIQRIRYSHYGGTYGKRPSLKKKTWEKLEL